MAEPGRPDPSAPEARQVDRLAFTLDADTGEILKYEAVDAAGVRRELSANEKRRARQRSDAGKLSKI